MRIHRRSFHTVVALVTSASVLFTPIVPVLRAQTAAAPKSTAAKPAAAASNATGAAAVDGGWPRDFVTSTGGALRVFQPQIASWDGQRKIVALSAVSFIPKGASKQTMGTVKFEGDTSVAVDQRLVNFSNVKVSESSFQNAPTDQVKEITGEIVNQVPKDGLVIGLDRVLARLDKSTIIPKNVAEVKADPPPIFYSTTPAILVNIDSDPIWSPIMGNDLKFAVNTNWDLFQHSQTNAYYLRYNESWLSATDIKGEWKPAGTLPDS